MKELSFKYFLLINLISLSLTILTMGLFA